MARLFDFWERARQSPYAQGAAVLIAGSAFTQLIPLAASPFIGRIFSPADFGIYSVFLSIVNIAGGCACLKYELAAVSAKDEKSAYGIVFLCIILSLAASLLLFAALFILGKTELLPAPVSTFFTSVFAAANCLMLRLGRYKTSAAAAMVKALVMYVFQIILGALGFGRAALMWGQALGYTCGCAVMLASQLRKVFSHSLKQLKAYAREFQGFPRFTLGGSLFTLLGANLVVFFISYIYGEEVLGRYSAVNQILGLPLTVISAAIGNLFFKKSSEGFAAGKGDVKVFKTAFFALSALSLPIFTALFWFAPIAVEIMLGAGWLDSIAILRILLPLFAVRFIITPLTNAAISAGRQKGAMLCQMMLFFASALPAALQFIFKFDVYAFLLIYALFCSVSYIIFFFYCRRLYR